MRISLCMVVKNEEKNITSCLDRALKVADEAVIVDTGSTDKTVELLRKKYGNDPRVKILEEEWENDISRARNKSLEHATGDWILVLDADERISCNREQLEAFLHISNKPAYRIPIYNIYGENNFVMSTSMVRLFKNNNPKYKGAIHEQLEIDGQSCTGEVIDKDICRIYHYGYMNIINEEICKDPEEMIGENYDSANSVGNSANWSEEFERYKREAKESIGALIERGMLSEAKEAVKEYESMVTDDTDIYSIKGVIAMMEGDLNEAEKVLINGLALDKGNFDILYNLGYLYQSMNKNELAIEYYKKAMRNARDEDSENEVYEILKSLGVNESPEEIRGNIMPKTSIVVLTYNNLECNRLCIESIKEFTPEGTYEIIVVDNNSTDGTVEWLKSQKGIKLILNDENMGFPKGCNQGIKAAEKGNDILLLNNDVIVTPNWLTNLKKCLYSSSDIGAVGSVTNSCSNLQAIPVSYSNLEELIDFAMKNNVSNESMWEERLRLVGFCMLIKNEVVKKIGLLDEIFSPGNFEDDDYSLRIRKAGYRLMLCKDSFIHHFGNVSFGKLADTFRKLLICNRQKFAIKWGIDPYYFADIKREITELISNSGRREINVLHVGCYGGGTLLDIKNAIPSARLFGIEPVKEAVEGITPFAHIETGNLERISVFKKNYFDFIINSQLQENEEDIINFLKVANDYLKDDGVVYITPPLNINTGWDEKFAERLDEKVSDYSIEIVLAANGNRILSAVKSKEKGLEML